MPKKASSKSSLLSRKTSLERMKRSKGDLLFDTILLIVLTLIFILVAYPLYFIIISSISDPIAVANGKVTIFPIGFTLEGYSLVFKEKSVMRGFMNSIFYSVVGVSINLITTIPTGYALSRKDFLLQRPIIAFYLITMFINGGMMPTYLVVKDTGLIDTIWALVIPGAVSVFNLIVCRTFFMTNIPIELLEASKLDGCGNTRFFFHIVLPLSAAITAIMVLYYGVGHWNSYFSALLYINDRYKWPLQMELRSILLQNSLQLKIQLATPEAIEAQQRAQALIEVMKYSLIIISSIPVMVLYPVIQKYFVKGVTLGSVKG